MRRKAFIYGWLLLPGWLAVIANISFNAAFDSGGPDNSQAAFSVPAEHGQHGSPKDIPPIRHALHHLVRRAWISGETDGRPYELTGAITGASVAWRPNVTLVGVVKTPADILQSWNFHVRNALEPRAPSATSLVS